MLAIAGTVIAVAAVDVLLPNAISFVAVTVTVLVTLLGAANGAVARIRTTAVSPGAKVGMVTLAVLLVPEATVPAFVVPIKEVPDTNVAPAGSVSTTLTEVAVDGPLFVTFMVYVIVVPATDEVGPVLLIATSFCCVSVVVIEAELLLVGVSTVAVSVVLITALLQV